MIETDLPLIELNFAGTSDTNGEDHHHQQNDHQNIPIYGVFQ